LDQTFLAESTIIIKAGFNNKPPAVDAPSHLRLNVAVSHAIGYFQLCPANSAAFLPVGGLSGVWDNIEATLRRTTIPFHADRR
jgi:hypothetical protein